MSFRLICIALAAAAASLASSDAAYAQAPAGGKAMRVDLDAVHWPESAREAIAAARTGGYPAITVPLVLGDDGADAFDPLAAILGEARDKGLSVQLSVRVGAATWPGALPNARDHVIYAHPDWLVVPRTIAAELHTLQAHRPDYIGRLMRWSRANAADAGLFLSPLHPEAVAYAGERLRQLLRAHAVDSVHLDARSFADTDWDYSRVAIAAFKQQLWPRLTAAERQEMVDIEALDPTAYADEFPEAWEDFRRSRLAAFVARLRAIVQDVRPGATVTVSLPPGIDLDSPSTSSR